MNLEFKKEHWQLIDDGYSLIINNTVKSLPIVQAYREFSPGVYVSIPIQVMVTEEHIVLNAEKGFDGKVALLNDEVTENEGS